MWQRKQFYSIYISSHVPLHHFIPSFFFFSPKSFLSICFRKYLIRHFKSNLIWVCTVSIFNSVGNISVQNIMDDYYINKETYIYIYIFFFFCIYVHIYTYFLVFMLKNKIKYQKNKMYIIWVSFPQYTNNNQRKMNAGINKSTASVIPHHSNYLFMY